jgi:hypothetical protein
MRIRPTAPRSSNFGFVIQDYAAPYDDLTLRSREAATALKRPKLTITYDLPGISPDRLEPNDSFATAQDRGRVGDHTEIQMNIHAPNNDDYFKVTAANTGPLTVDLLFNNSFGNLDLFVCDSNQQQIGSSTGSVSNEHVGVLVTAGRVYFIRVTGKAGATSPNYTLVIHGPAIPPHRFEPNDSFAAATELGTLEDQTESGLSIHSFNDHDIFKLTAAATGTLNVSLNFATAEGIITFVVSDGNLRQIGQAEGFPDNQHLAVPVIGGQVYFIHVLPIETNPNYSLVIDRPSVPMNTTVSFQDGISPAATRDTAIKSNATSSTLAALNSVLAKKAAEYFISDLIVDNRTIAGLAMSRSGITRSAGAGLESKLTSVLGGSISELEIWK